MNKNNDDNDDDQKNMNVKLAKKKLSKALYHILLYIVDGQMSQRKKNYIYRYKKEIL